MLPSVVLVGSHPAGDLAVIRVDDRSGAQLATIISPHGTPAGAGIVAVTKGGPADRAGLRPGDVIKARWSPRRETQNLFGLKPEHQALGHDGPYLFFATSRAEIAAK